jgi:predicted acetyltransferase
MNHPFKYGQVSDSDEAKLLNKILVQCFNGTPEQGEVYQKSIGIENFRILCQDKEIIGGLALYSMGQWFGGESIPITGIAAVGIVPEYRGTGAAKTLMSEVLKELYTKDIPISTLYPATQRLYRSVGYEQAGTYCRWEVPLSSLSLTSRDLPIQKIKNPKPELFIDTYRQQAKKINGYLDRNLAIWQTILDSSDGEIYAYWVGETEKRQGYIIFQQRVIEQELCIQIKDWAALTPAAMKRLWTFVADHRSQVEKCRWTGGTVQPKLMLLSEQTGKILSQFIWFLRVINVPKALEMRPYPKHLEIELDFAITDELLPENSSHFKLQVSGGRGKVSQGGKGDLKLNVKALAPLYTGLYTASQLYDLDQLEASEQALQLATELFLLPNPALPDFF